MPAWKPSRSSTSSTLSFECSQPDCTFACALAAAGTTIFTDSNCTSPFTYPTVDGPYAFTVTATNADGLAGEPATWEWTVDTEVPVLENLTGPSSPTTSTQAQFSYSCSKENCSFSCQVSEATQGLLFGPISCIGSFSYPVSTDGTYTFTVVATDQAQNESQPSTWTWTVDREAPEIIDLQGPEGLISETNPLFAFGCSKTDCTLLCSLSGQGQGDLFTDEDCSTGSRQYSALADDEYTFSVRAIDAAGNQGFAMTRSFQVNTPPAIENLAGPSGLTNDNSPTFSFDCSKSACTFECLLEGPENHGPEACDSGSITYTDLPDGTYTFTVRAIDSLDVTGPSETISFTIDIVFLELLFLETPEEVITDDWAPFDFECTNKDNCTFTCRLDEAFAPGTPYVCSPPLVVGALEVGEYTFTVDATDGAGNEANLSYSFAVVNLGWEQVSTGTAHTCGVATDRSLWCWGNGGDHRLGLGFTNKQILPRQVSSEKNWRSVDAGFAHSCAIRIDGTLWCWGNGGGGRLGNDSTTTETLPSQVGSHDDWLQVVAADFYTCGIRAENNTLYCWGNNASGRLGIGDEVTIGPYYTPQEVSTGWAYVSASMAHSCGIKLDGRLYCWGWGNRGRLGVGNTLDRFAPTEVIITDLPSLLQPDLPWISVSAGHAHTCAVRSDNSLWCWGFGSEGRLGTGATTDRTTPALIGIDFEWESVQAGGIHTCAQRLDGTLRCWGLNRKGQLGVESPNELLPHQVNTRTDWTSFSLGGSHSCAIDEDTVLHCWGSNQDGRLGIHLDDGPQNFPTPITFDKEVAQIDAGQHNGCLITTAGELYCWGHNRYGHLGIGVRNDRALPTRVGTFSDWSYVATAIGSDAPPSTATGHTCALRDDGSLYCWGYGFRGRLGLGDINDRTTPTQVSPGTTWSHVAVGSDHSCAIDSDGILFCWGFNLRGQIGHDDTSNSVNEPEQVGANLWPDATWSDATAGGDHSCGIKTDGTLWCWGNGSQLGINETGSFYTPQQVGTDNDWDRVVAGNSHTCALKTNRTLWCWGSTTSGRLGHSGNGTIPAQVGTDQDWAVVAPGFDHTCALKTNGGVFCWGRGTEGRLGTGNLDATNSTPQQTLFSDWTHITAGGRHTLGVRSSQIGAFSWGDNFRTSITNVVAGQLGTDTAFKRVPTRLDNETTP